MKPLVLAFTLVLAALTPVAAQNMNVIATDADDGATVEVPFGGQLTLSLSKAGGAPYTWQITNDGSPQLALTGQRQVAQSGRLGGPVDMVFTFTAADAGDTMVSADYVPVTGGQPQRSVSLEVHVVPARAQDGTQ
jgi:predicted secreted protein